MKKHYYYSFWNIPLHFVPLNLFIETTNAIAATNIISMHSNEKNETGIMHSRQKVPKYRLSWGHEDFVCHIPRMAHMIGLLYGNVGSEA